MALNNSYKGTLNYYWGANIKSDSDEARAEAERNLSKSIDSIIYIRT